jgi:hypothetical protein
MVVAVVELLAAVVEVEGIMPMMRLIILVKMV